jgi:hypothetical protein
MRIISLFVFTSLNRAFIQFAQKEQSCKDSIVCEYCVASYGNNVCGSLKKKKLKRWIEEDKDLEIKFSTIKNNFEKIRTNISNYYSKDLKIRTCI